jgi:hypothetical protein
MHHVSIRENAVCEAIPEFYEITVSHIPGQNNPANIFTKEFKSDVIFCTLWSLLLSYPSLLQVIKVPCLDGGS